MALTVDDGAWLDPITAKRYPLAFHAYRRVREAEERPLAHHRRIGADIDFELWRRHEASQLAVDVTLVIRTDAPYRIRRLALQVLRAIRRGAPPTEAIRRVSRRFGLRHSQARAFLVSCLSFTLQRRPDVPAPYARSA